MNTKLKLTGMMVLAAVFLAPQVSFAAEDTAQILAQKKAELNGHEWEIKLVPASDPKNGTPTTDVLVFKDMKFEAKAMTADGYQPTNYTISLQEGGPSVWETMQSSDSGPAIFWRGEWEGESMRGVMSKQKADGTNDSFYFSSVSSKVVEDTPKVEEVVPTPPTVEAVPVVEGAAAAVEEVKAAEVPEVVPAIVEEVKTEVVNAVEAPKKKKGWF